MKTSPLSAAWRVALLILPPILYAAPALAEPAVYELDPEHSAVHFEVLHFGTSTIHGRIGPVDPAGDIDGEADGAPPFGGESDRSNAPDREPHQGCVEDHPAEREKYGIKWMGKYGADHSPSAPRTART